MLSSSHLKKAGRLLAALGQFTAEEAIWLRVPDRTRAQAAHDRAAPLLTELGRIAADPAVAAALRPKLEAWREARRQNRSRIGELRNQLLSEGERIATARLRLAQLLPIYREDRVRRSRRLQAAV
jgi:hypothetical protein